MSAQQSPHFGHRLLHFVAIGFGAGAVPRASGTFGTLMAVPLYLLLRELSLPAYLAVVVVLFVAGIGICHAAQRHFGTYDHPAIVWDEIVGYLLTMILAPPGWIWVIIGFALFRLFDIWKPFPIRLVERTVQGGLGTMLDDVLAALYSFVVLQALAYYFA